MEREREKDWERKENKWEKRAGLANISFCINGMTFLQYLENPFIANEKRHDQTLKHRNVITIIMITTTNVF